jgi:hypothetical protein
VTERVETTWGSARQALDRVFAEVVSVAPGWLVAGVALHVLHQVVRTRAWFNIIRAACPDATELRARDVTMAYLAGTGLNGIVPARGGDLAKLILIRRRTPRTGWSTLAATLVPETLLESLVAATLLLWALSMGLLPAPGLAAVPSPDVLVIRPGLLSIIVMAAAGGALVVAWRTLRAPARRLIGRLRQGLAILGRPRDFFLGVATWQILGRIIRFGSLAALMAAFGLPVTPATVLLVMAVQGGGRIVPTAPASAGVRIALLAYGLGALSDNTVAVASVTAFSVGAAAILAGAGVAITLAIIGRELGTASPHAMVRRLRDRLGESALSERGACAMRPGPGETRPA